MSTSKQLATKPILIHLSAELLMQLNEAATTLGRSRSEIIRTSLERDVSYVLEHEVPPMRTAQQASATTYANWRSARAQAAKGEKASAKKQGTQLKSFKAWLLEGADGSTLGSDFRMAAKRALAMRKGKDKRKTR